MSREKQIEEMAKSMCRLYGTELCGEECADNNSCDVERLSCNLYDAGYRKQEWISVEERLPTGCENVLCFEKGKVYVAFLEHAEYSTIWWDWVDFDRDDTWTERTPTHWMPLPKPPKRKRK